jgi:WD40 repeat protein
MHMKTKMGALAVAVAGVAATVFAAVIVAVSGCAGPQVPIEPRKVEIHPLERGALEVKQLKTEHKNIVGAVAFSPDGRWALTGDGAWFFTAGDGGLEMAGEGQLILWKLDGTGGMSLEARQKTAHAGSVCAVAFSPDGRWALTGGMDKDRRTGSLILWKLDDDGGMTRQGDVHRERACYCAVAFSPDGKWALTGSFNDEQRRGTLILWKLDGKGGMQIAKEVPDTKGATLAVAISPDGKWALTVTFGGDAHHQTLLWMLDGEGGITQHEVTHGQGGFALAFSPDGAWVSSGELWRFDGSGRMTSVRLKDTAWDRQILAFAPDSKWALGVVFPSRREEIGGLAIRRLDRSDDAATAPWLPATKFAVESAVVAAISSDGRWVLTGGTLGSAPEDGPWPPGAVRLWEVK